MSTYTTTMTTKEIEQLRKKLANATPCKTPPYAIFQVKTSDCTITAYASGKVVYQGEGASFYVEGTQSKTNTPTTYPECGSDEVGTGDYFGPVIVCATCVENKHLPLLKELKIQDSKQIQDGQIKQIAPVLMEHLTYSLLVLENAKYNEVHQYHNMNAIKAKLHNQAFLHLKNKLTFTCSRIIIDQFTPENTYYRYLKDDPSIVKGIHFETKAENKYLSVACASIIARYHFLEAIEQLSVQYDFPFPKGAGDHVDEAGVLFVEQHSLDALVNVCKLHFKNTDKIKALL